jgi:hypothetical protein
MKSAVLALLAIALHVPVSFAQERIPDDEAERYAKLLVDEAKKLTNLPFSLECDPTKPVGLHAEEYGAMAIPAVALSAEKLKAIPKDGLPVGQLWMRKLTLQAASANIPTSDLRVVPITIDGTELNVSLFLLSVHKTDDDKLELRVYGKGEKPLQKLELKALATPSTESVDRIDLQGKHRDDDTADLVLKIVSAFEATLRVAPCDD